MVITETGEKPSIRALELMEQLPLDARVSWCLGPVPTTWQSFAVEHGVRWVTKAGLPPLELAQRCLALEHGASLFVQVIDGMTVDSARARDILSQVTDWQTRILRHSLSGDAARQVIGTAFNTALDMTSDETLVSRDLQNLLDQDQWVQIFCDGKNLIDSARLVSDALSGSVACG